MSQNKLDDMTDDSTDGEDNSEDVEQELKEIAEDTGTDLEDIEEQYQNLLAYSVGHEEAIRSVAARNDASNPETSQSDASLDDTVAIDSPEMSQGQWVSVAVEVYGAWSPRTPAISQKAHLVDESGLIDAIVWDKSSLDGVEPGEEYLIDNAVVDVDDETGREYLSLNSQTSIKEVDEDVELPGSL